jgi:hypothetical protein
MGVPCGKPNVGRVSGFSLRSWLVGAFVCVCVFAYTAAGRTRARRSSSPSTRRRNCACGRGVTRGYYRVLEGTIAYSMSALCDSPHGSASGCSAAAAKHARRRADANGRRNPLGRTAVGAGPRRVRWQSWRRAALSLRRFARVTRRPPPPLRRRRFAFDVLRCVELPVAVERALSRAFSRRTTPRHCAAARPHSPPPPPSRGTAAAAAAAEHTQ